MFVLDIETLGVESNSVVLSVGAIHLSSTEPCAYEDLIKESIFIKFSAKQQINRYNRIVSSDTLDWWKKQSDLAKKTNYMPLDTDVETEEGISMLTKWVKKVGNPGDMCWIRGSLDQVCLDSLFRAVGIEPLFPYNQYRDIRTAIDLLYPDTSKNGYVDVDSSKCFGFAREKVLKHHPVHDSAYDAAMLLFGKE